MENPLPCLMFVDDLEVFSTSMEEFVLQQSIINDFAEDWNLIINKSKTHIMTTRQSEALKHWCDLHGLEKEPSKHNRYLGAQVNPSGMTGNAHVSARIGKCQGMVQFMQKKGLASGRLPVSTALRIFKTVVVPSLLYGMECMELSDYEISRLDYFMANQLAKILHGGTLLGPVEWTLWEAGCLPAKILISMAALRLQRKISLMTKGFSIAKLLLSSIPTNENWFKQIILNSKNIWGERLVEEINSPSPPNKTALNLQLGRKASKWMRRQMDTEDSNLLISNAMQLKGNLAHQTNH